MNVVRETIDYRQKHKISRDDFLQLLLQMKEEGVLTFEQIAAQCFVFFLGGFETASSTMSWGLYELAVNGEIQTKARKEVVAVMEKYGGKLDYESVQELKYLKQIIDGKNSKIKYFYWY